MPGISVTLIAKNCPTHLKECLDSLKDFVRPELGDEIVVLDTGSTDNTAEVARACGARVFIDNLSKPGMRDLVRKYLPDHAETLEKDPQFGDGFLADFAGARQQVTDAAANDIVFWIDSDDVLAGGAQLRAYAEQFFGDPSNTCLFLRYDYSFDADGQCNTTLWRERLLRRTHYVWKGRCHESMIPKDGVPQKITKVADPGIAIVHKNGRSHTVSDIRNYAILRNDYESSPEWRDPRTEFYLGNAARGLGLWSESVEWYTKVLERSGSRDDRLACCLNIGAIYLIMARPWRALDWFLQATKVHPQDPRPWFGAARCYHDVRRFKDCLLYSGIARAIPTPEYITSVDPMGFDFYPNVFEAMSFKELDDVPNAVQSANRLISLRPDFKPAVSLAQDIQGWAQKKAITEAVLTTTDQAFSHQARREIIQRLRPEVRKQIVQFQVERAATPPNHSITFLCPRTVEPWDPTSEGDGIGGSEKMVIQLARRFAAAGWKVDVYGAPKEANAYKVFDRVAYRPLESFNPEFKRDIVIIWRNPAFLDYALQANRIYLDLHDVPNPAEYSPARLERLAGIFFKSNYHRSLLPAVPDAKCIVTRNGIDLSHFPDPMPARDLRKIIWCSSADRGLLGALRTWGRIRNEFPDASFHVFYGFTPLYLNRAAQIEYQHFGDLGTDHHMLDYAELCFQTMERHNVINHGRVGHKALAAELSTAGIWFYPTAFNEISCMSAMEAQAAGAIPVCSDTGALKETVSYGHRCGPRDPDAAVQAIRDVFRRGHDLDTYRAEMMKDARARFDIQALAEQWLALFAAPTAAPILVTA